MENYGRRVVVDLPFEMALTETIQALHLEGFDIVSRFDVRQFLNRTLHHEFRRYALLQAVTPQLTLDVLQEDLSAGAVLPVTIAVFELADGETAVVVGEPFGPMLSDLGWRAAVPRLAAVADRECEQLARALDRLRRAALRHVPISAAALEQFT